MSNRNAWEITGQMRRKLERRAQATAFYLRPGPSSVILDLGCADGFVDSHFLIARFVIGLDLSRRSLITAKQHNRHPNFDLVNADGTAVPIKGDSVNEATLLEILEHLPRDKQQLVASEVDRVLTRKGTLTVSVPYNEKIPSVKAANGKSAPRFGHLSVMNEEKVRLLLPHNYVLKAKCHLVNFETLTLWAFFQYLPIRPWLVLNRLFGFFRKGYWLILRYDKM